MNHAFSVYPACVQSADRRCDSATTELLRLTAGLKFAFGQVMRERAPFRANRVEDRREDQGLAGGDAFIAEEIANGDLEALPAGDGEAGAGRVEAQRRACVDLAGGDPELIERWREGDRDVVAPGQARRKRLN